ncbi:DUF4279 domain-containing protein [Streptomyces cellostaticus]|uniref:DUF4279 domain-containing protein n=1 Tax=Streptomyces cellostaticus TaxID=67285 RepID=UPI00099EDAD9|nr:DUF4279 domain-containing protein [Streptomyces cellostaticus]GHI08117.1 hypothetical protein Scel_64380 [Streptomyces cellostaticus]
MPVTKKRHWVLTDVSLVVKGRDLQPEEITSFLGIEPTGVRNPGPSKWDHPGKVDGEWGINCNENVSRDFHEQLGNILSTVESKRTELAQLVERGYEVIVDIYGFAGNDCSLTLQPEELKRIARLGFPLWVAANMNER